MRSPSSSTSASRGVGAELLQLIDQIGREKGIDSDVLVSALEDAITTASRKAQERAPARGGAAEVLISRLDRSSGQLHLFARKRVSDPVADHSTEIALSEALRIDPTAEVGRFVDLPRSTKGLGRIEAQAAKQVIALKVREAERENVYNEYAPRVGELLNSTVKRFERGDVILDLGRTEAVLPRRYQSRSELLAAGDRIRAAIVEVSKHAKGPQVTVSRIDPVLLLKLFEMEVPEIYDGTVTLKQVVREAGERAKVAVTSRQRDVDAVGACVGMKGSRVQAIIRELRGEKIDVIQWSEEISGFAANALNPAKVSRVTLRAALGTSDERSLEAVVDDTQLSLAIGKKGQNVRLASRLVGHRIDIRSEEEVRREAELKLARLARRAARVSEVPGLAAAATLELLSAAGIATVGELADLAGPAGTAGAVAPGDPLERLRALAQAWIEAATVPAEEPEPAGPLVAPGPAAVSGPA